MALIERANLLTAKLQQLNIRPFNLPVLGQQQDQIPAAVRTLDCITDLVGIIGKQFNRLQLLERQK